MNYKLEKVNESFYSLELSDKKIETQIKQLLTQEKPPAFGSPFKFPTKIFFFRIHDNKMIIPIGLIPFLAKFGIYRNESEINSEFSKEEILDYIENCGIPFKPYEHQINMIVDSLIIQKQINISCTGCVAPETVFECWIE